MKIKTGFIYLLLLALSLFSRAQTNSSSIIRNNLVLPPDYKTVPYGSIPDFVKKGNGKQTVILIPGLGLDGSVFNDFMEANASVYTMYAITVPGYGKSFAPSLPSTDTSYGLQYWNRGVQQGLVKLIEAEKLEKPVIAGFFVQGTQLALRMAIDYPQLVGGVIVLGGPAKFVLIQQGKPKEFPLKSSIAQIDRYVAQQWFKQMSKPDFDKGNYAPEIYSLNKDSGMSLWQQVSRVPLPVIVRYLCEFYASDITLELDKIKCPVLVLRPSFNEMILNNPVNNYLVPQFISTWDNVAGLNAQFSIKTIPQAAVCIWKDNPKIVYSELAEFSKIQTIKSEKMEILKHAISWAEIPAIQFQRAKTFYSRIYAFDMPEMQMGPNKMGILLHDQPGGGIGAAIVEGSGYVPSENGIRIYLNAGKNLDAVLSRVTEAGGIVKLPKTAIAPGLGFFAAFEDTEGNYICLHSQE